MRILLCALLAACAAHPGPRATLRTTIAADAAPLLDAWAAALGGRARLARVRLVHTTGKLETSGLSGTLSTWETAGGERREEAELGGVERWLDIVAGEGAWHSDRNRKVRPLEGVELEEQRALAYLGAWGPLLPERLAGKITRQGDGVLLIEPDGGRPLTVTFDAETHLPVTIAHPSGAGTRILGLGDWREVDGIRFPFRVVTVDGDAGHGFGMRVDRITLDGALPAFSRPPDPPPDYRFTESGRAVIPFRHVASLILVEVAVNGSTPRWFVVDTGAEVTVINGSRLASLGLTPVGALSAEAGGGNVDMSYVKGVSFALAGLSLTDQTVTSIVLDPIEQAIGHPLDGILGYDFVSRFVVRLDYAAHSMTLWDPAQAPSLEGTKVPLIFSGATPRVRASLEVPGAGRVEAFFELDTGCTCEVSFNAPFTRAHRLIETAVATFTPPKGTSRGAGGVTQDVIGRVEGFSLGGVALPSLIASFGQDSAGSQADPDYAGLLGSRLLRRFIVTLDYGHGAMWLEPSPAFATPSRLVRAGVSWKTEGARLVVGGLLDDYPGQRAGLRVGDVVVSIDGAPADRGRADDLLMAPGPRRLVVERGGKTLTISVTPRELL